MPGSEAPIPAADRELANGNATIELSPVPERREHQLARMRRMYEEELNEFERLSSFNNLIPTDPPLGLILARSEEVYVTMPARLRLAGARQGRRAVEWCQAQVPQTGRSIHPEIKAYRGPNPAAGERC
jgi:hypothetical protein